MSVYKLTVDARGRKMYFKDKKLTAKKEIPTEVLEQLDAGAGEVDPETTSQSPAATSPAAPEEPAIDKHCIFCGEPGYYPKFIHGRTVYLCEDHYQTQNTGHIGAKVRQMINDEEAAAQATSEPTKDDQTPSSKSGNQESE